MRYSQFNFLPEEEKKNKRNCSCHVFDDDNAFTFVYVYFFVAYFLIRHSMLCMFIQCV